MYFFLYLIYHLKSTLKVDSTFTTKRENVSTGSCCIKKLLEYYGSSHLKT